MKLPWFYRKTHLFLAIIFTANIFFLFGTWLFHFYYYQLIAARWQEASGIKYLIRELSLATENTIATWYSSMLFLLVAIMSLICYIIQRSCKTDRQSKFISLGWLMFFLIFGLLSFDEIASIHERLGNLGALNPLGDDPPGWFYLLGIPIALVGTLMLLFCRMIIKQAPLAAGFAVTGILLFLSIPVQEFFEMEAWGAAPDKETWMRPVQFLLIEEGSEILGVSLMLLSSIVYVDRISESRKFHEVLGEELKKNKRILLLSIFTGCILLTLPMVISHFLETGGENGIVKNWFPAATAFIGTLFSIYIYYYKTVELPPSRRNIYIVLALFCLLISAYFGSDMYSHFHHLQEEWLKIIFSSLVFPAILILAYRRLLFNGNVLGKIRIITWATLLIAALVFSNSYSAGIAYAAFSIFLYSLCIRFFFVEKVPEKTAGVRIANPRVE